MPDRADQGVGPVARLQAAVPRRVLPGTWDQVLSLAHHVVCEGSAPLSRFLRYAATHATPHGSPIAVPRGPLAPRGGEEGRDALCDSLARRHGEGDRQSCDTTSASSRSEALAACHDKDAVERRFGDARGPPGLRTPRVSAEGTPAGKLLVVFVALVPAAWLRRWKRESGLDGDHALGSLLDEAGATGRHAREGHRPRVCEVTGRQRDIFDRLGYGLPTTS